MNAVDHPATCKRNAPNESIYSHYAEMATREAAERRREISDRMWPLMTDQEQHELCIRKLGGSHIDQEDGGVMIMYSMRSWQYYDDYFNELTHKYLFMKDYTEEEIQEALKKIETMEHIEMAKLWRFAPEGSEIYFQNTTPVHEAFKARFFAHFGGFTPEISKQIGWKK